MVEHSSKPHMQQPIVLIGLMGAGKTTVGRRLAKALNIPFADSDHEIEKAASLSVSEIFEVFGEAEFRRGERRVIQRLLSDTVPKVIALGGGAFLDKDTRAIVKEKALSIWLDVDVALLVKRTSRRKTRPLLLKGDPKNILMTLAEERYPIYQKADIRVQSSKGAHGKVVEEILAAMAQHLQDQA